MFQRPSEGSSWAKPLADGCIVVVSAAGEDEVDGAYVEMARPVVSNKENGRPSCTSPAARAATPTL